MPQADVIFATINWLALAGWLALLVSPLKRDLAIPAARVMAALLCGVYVSLILRGISVGPGLPEGAGFDSLDGVAKLLSTREAILGGWVHFLAFDLFVGSWQAEDAPKAGVPHWLLVPCLALTLLAGPAGLLLYLLLAAGFRLSRRSRG